MPGGPSHKSRGRSSGFQSRGGKSRGGGSSRPTRGRSTGGKRHGRPTLATYDTEEDNDRFQRSDRYDSEATKSFEFKVKKNALLFSPLAF